MSLCFLLFVLNFSNLIIPFVLRIQLPVDVLEPTEESLQLVQRPPGADLVRLLGVAVAVPAVVHVVPRVAAATTAAVDAVRVGWRLSVAEVARMSTPTDSSGHSRLLDFDRNGGPPGGGYIVDHCSYCNTEHVAVEAE